jgi:hypothetical protein
VILLVCISISLAQVDTMWTSRYSGAAGYNDTPCDVTVDNIGNVYATGFTSVGGPSVFTKDYATIKYNASGDSVWLNTYNGPWSKDDYPIGVELSANNDVYICGSSMGMDATFDYGLVKYNNDGLTQWIRHANGPWGDHDHPTAFLVDDSGDIYVTGFTNGALTYQDIMTIKYSSIGDTVWIRTYNHVADKNDVAGGIAVDIEGNLYIVGRSWDYVTKDDCVTLKYDTLGNEIWIARYNGISDSSDNAIACAIDDSGFVYVTGTSWVPGSGHDIVTIKYDSGGDTVWTRFYNGSANDNDYPAVIATDGLGNVYVAGYCKETNVDYCTIKYDNSGNELWVAHYDGPGNGIDRARAMAIDDSGNVYVTGESFGAGTIYDYATVKYNSNGSEVWIARYNGPANSTDKAYALAVDNNGYVYVTGESFGGPGAYMDYLTIKYSQETGVEEIIAKKCLPAMSIRNPIFLNESEIAFTLSEPDNLALQIYDIQGRLIKTLVNAYFEEGEYYIRWMGHDTHKREVPAGVYLVRLMTSSNEITQKIIKLH